MYNYVLYIDYFLIITYCICKILSVFHVNTFALVMFIVIKTDRYTGMNHFFKSESYKKLFSYYVCILTIQLEIFKML